MSAGDPKWIESFVGLSPVQFDRLVALVRRRGGDIQRGRPWRLPLEDRVFLVATYWRTNLTLRQVALLSGISKSAADRILNHLAPLLAISPARRGREGTVYIVDGTLVPTRDRTVAASSKNYRYSTNPQVVIDANSRLVVAIGDPLPGSRNDCRAFTESGVDRACHGVPTLADGGYQGTGLLIPHRKRRGQRRPSPQQEAKNAVHRRARARVTGVSGDAEAALRSGGAVTQAGKDAELLVLRHENVVLRRQLAGPVRYESVDRLWFAALAPRRSGPPWGAAPAP